MQNHEPEDISSSHYLENNSTITLIGVCRCDVFVKIFLKIILLIPFIRTSYSRRC